MDPNLSGVSKKPPSIGQIGRMDSVPLGNRKTWGQETAGYLSWRAEWRAANAIELEDEVGDREFGGGFERRAVRQASWIGEMRN